MHTPLITFIVPVYKVDYDQLNKCVSSILNQNRSDKQYEILLIDDGSPDRCGEICDAFALENDIVHVIHQTNQGLSVVRNVGVENARGEWVAFVDGDDWIEPNTFEFAKSMIDTAPVDSDILLWDGFAETSNHSQPILFFDTNDGDLHAFKGAEKEKVIDRILPLHVTGNDIDRCASLGVTWARIYRRSMLTENNVTNVPGLRLMQDSVFNLWAIEYARTICYQNKPLYHYSMYDTSISKKYDPNAIEPVLWLNRLYSEYVQSRHDTPEFWQRIYIRTVRMTVKCLSKDYANPLNKAPFSARVKKMKKDMSTDSLQTAFAKCNASGQEWKFRFILFLLKHHLYGLCILTSRAFGILRSFKSRRK